MEETLLMLGTLLMLHTSLSSNPKLDIEGWVFLRAEVGTDTTGSQMLLQVHAG